MPVLTERQIKKGYFDIIGGFPALNSMELRDNPNFAREVKDYKGQKRLCISCTQLTSIEHTKYFNVQGYTEREKKRILAEWIEFLQTNKKTFKALHFNSHVPQRLFDAACHQENLEELRFKWGGYSDLSALKNLKKLKFLYIGSGASIKDISALGELKTLVVLLVENFKRIEDFSALTALDQLEQLKIYPNTLGRIAIKDLEFLREMKNLLSFSIGSATIRKKYSPEELKALCVDAPNLQDAFINGRIM